MNDTSLCFLKAVDLAHKIRSGEISALETMEAHLAQIEKVNPQVNAIVTLVPELALEQACSRASSGTKVTMALTCGLTFSICARCASIVSKAEISPERILCARSTAFKKQREVSFIFNL